MQSWREQARSNLAKYGDQTWAVLALATLEELGELCRAVLHHEYEGGDAESVMDELCDVAALGYAIHWKRTGYPEGVFGGDDE